MTGAIVRIYFDGNEDTLDDLIQYIKETPGTTVKEMQTFDEWVNYDG